MRSTPACHRGICTHILLFLLQNLHFLLQNLRFRLKNFHLYIYLWFSQEAVAEAAAERNAAASSLTKQRDAKKKSFDY